MQTFVKLMLSAAQPVFNAAPVLQFLVAFAVAAAADSLQKLKAVAVALRQQAQVDSDVQAERLKCCELCPYFFRPLRTCGTALPGGPRDEYGHVVGCGCVMDIKCKALANCWAYDRFHGDTIIGWPAKLNSFPAEQSGAQNE